MFDCVERVNLSLSIVGNLLLVLKVDFMETQDQRFCRLSTLPINSALERVMPFFIEDIIFDWLLFFCIMYLSNKFSVAIRFAWCHPQSIAGIYFLALDERKSNRIFLYLNVGNKFETDSFISQRKHLDSMHQETDVLSIKMNWRMYTKLCMQNQLWLSSMSCNSQLLLHNMGSEK